MGCQISLKNTDFFSISNSHRVSLFSQINNFHRRKPRLSSFIKFISFPKNSAAFIERTGLVFTIKHNLTSCTPIWLIRVLSSIHFCSCPHTQLLLKHLKELGPKIFCNFVQGLKSLQVNSFKGKIIIKIFIKTRP